MVNAIIADDNKDFCMMLANELNVTKEIKVIEMLSEGTKVIQEIRRLQPEILILDLKMPGRNGIQIIEEINEDSSIKTKIIVISGESKYIAKLVKYKCVISYIGKLYEMKEISFRIQDQAKEIEKNGLNQVILDYLLDLGFTTSNNGTFLIRDCIKQFLLTGRDECKVKELFQFVAEANMLQCYTVKNNVHNSTKVAWNIGDKNYIVNKMKLGATEELSPKKVITMSKYYIDIY